MHFYFYLNTTHQGSTNELYMNHLVMSVMMKFGNLFGGY